MLRRVAFRWLVASAAGLAGCADGRALVPDADATQGTGGVADAAARLDAGDAGGAIAAFLGNWVYATGTTTSSCPGELPSSDPASGPLVVTAGASAGSIIATQPGICALRFAVSRAVATIEPGQTCSLNDDAADVLTWDMISWTLTLSADGQKLDETLSSRMTIAPTSGATEECSYTETGVTLRRAQ
jgi:hypothetical protein